MSGLVETVNRALATAQEKVKYARMTLGSGIAMDDFQLDGERTSAPAAAGVMRLRVPLGVEKT